MYEALSILVDFFNANDRGLTIAELQTKEYKVLTFSDPLLKIVNRLRLLQTLIGLLKIKNKNKHCHLT